MIENNITKIVDRDKYLKFINDELGNIPNTKLDFETASRKAYLLNLKAEELQKPEERKILREDALNIISGINEISNLTKYVNSYHAYIRSYIYDPYISENDYYEIIQINKLLSFLDEEIKKCIDNNTKSFLLSKKASLLRFKSLNEISHNGKLKKLEEAERAKNLSKSLSINSGILLEEALIKWAKSDIAKNDKTFAKLINEVESALILLASKNMEFAKLTLLRYYRQTYNPLKCCSTFMDYTDNIQDINDIRSFLRISYLYAESAISLDLNNYSKETINTHVVNSLSLINKSIEAGYSNARNNIAKIYLETILGERYHKEDLLVYFIQTNNSELKLDWNKLSQELLFGKSKDNLILDQMVLGMDDPHIWSSLGTYFYEYHKDIELAKAFYNIGLQINRNHSLCLTNLARLNLLHAIDDIEVVQDSKKLLDRAKSNANRRFFWWRPLMRIANAKLGISRTSSHKIPEGWPVSRYKFNRIRELKKRYIDITNMDNGQQKGYELEKLMYAITSLSCTVVKPSYQTIHNNNAYDQIDGYFEFDNLPYRYECKCYGSKVPKDDIIRFADKLKIPGLKGLFVSLSGYNPSAITKTIELIPTTPIILFDKVDIESICLDQVPFDLILRQKIQELYSRNNPFKPFSLNNRKFVK